MNQTRRVLVVGVVGVCAVIATRAAAVLQDGDVLGSSNWAEAEGLLPNEILEHYKSGGYENQFLDLTLPKYVSIQHPPDFRAATQANRGRYKLTPAGSIVEVETGQQPQFIMGLPFPEVDPADPEAGMKIVWNYFYNTWYRGDNHFVNELVMLGRGGVERRIATEVRTRVYDGAPEARGRPNPHNLSSQRLARVTWPADLEGTTSLMWRFRDPGKHDSLWSFVPGLRRVRQVSALNRSDGFMGSDISLDDGDFFDGKPEDFTFRLVERRDQLVLMDPFAARGEAEILPAPGGGWRTLWKDVPRIGADAPDWQGLPWAPVSSALARRPVWIVEAKPKDPNYLYGRLVLRFDAETYYGGFASKYDRAGELLMSYQSGSGAFFPVDGTFISAGGTVVRTSENFLYQRATVVLFPPRDRHNPADYHVPTVAEQFTTDALIRLGK